MKFIQWCINKVYRLQVYHRFLRISRRKHPIVFKRLRIAVFTVVAPPITLVVLWVVAKLVFALGTPNTPLRMPALTNNADSKALWGVIGVATAAALLFFLIANRTRIAGWLAARRAARAAMRTVTATAGTTAPKSEIAKWIFGILVGALIIYGIWIGNWHAWWSNSINWVADAFGVFGHYWLVALGAVVLFLLLIYAGARDGKTASERLEKVAKLVGAFAWLAVLLCIAGFLLVFIIGPTKFWGQPMVIQQVPAQGAARGITTQAGAAGDQKRIDILAPVGTLATPLEQWGGPLPLYGRSSQMDALSDDGLRREGILAVNADGVIHIIGPGLDPDIGRPNILRFLSLTNFPLRVIGRFE